MEDVMFDSRPAVAGGGGIGEKRLMMELAPASQNFSEKRSNVNNNLATAIPPSKAIPHLTAERGEKRSASEALSHPPSLGRESTPSELQEKELVKRVAARVMMLPRESSDAQVTVFHGVNEPSIAFAAYVDRLVHYANVWAREKPGLGSQGVRCALLAIVYLERARVVISSKSVHRLFLIAFLIGIKLTDDFGISNTFWGRAGGCVLEDVNRMEAAFCNLLHWDFAVCPDAFETLKRSFTEGIVS